MEFFEMTIDTSVTSLMNPKSGDKKGPESPFDLPNSREKHPRYETKKGKGGRPLLR